MGEKKGTKDSRFSTKTALDVAILVPPSRESTATNIAQETPLTPFWIIWAIIPMPRWSFGRTALTPTQSIVGVDVRTALELIGGLA